MTTGVAPSGPEGFEYLPVPLALVDGEASLSFDLYILESGRYVLYRSADQPFLPEDSRRLAANGVVNLWLRPSAGPTMRRSLDILLGMPDDQVPALTKAGLVLSAAESVAQRVLENPQAHEIVAEVHEFVIITAGYLARSNSALQALHVMMHHDASICTHSANVVVYALALGCFSGLHELDGLSGLGLGAMLHDVGKTRIPLEILMKPGPLTEEEWEVLRQHPVSGVRLFEVGSDLPESSLRVILEHHERPDGLGYPAGATSREMHPFAKIVAVADAYDAMTSDRPYRPATTPYEALRELKREAGRQVEWGLFQNFVRVLGGLDRTRAWALPSALVEQAG